MNFNFDKVIADETNHLLPNINQHLDKDEYGEEALLDWQGKRIDKEDRVFVIRFKKTIGTIVPHTYASDDFFNTYLACDDNLIDLLDEIDTDLYWSMDITTGEELEHERK